VHVPSPRSALSWKSNWPDTQRRFTRWWNREGLLIGMWGAPDTGRAVHDEVPAPVRPTTLAERYCDAEFRAAENHHRLSRAVFPAEMLPLAGTDLGPGSLALFCGSQPGFAEDTVWFFPGLESVADPEELPPLRFDPANPWWIISERIVRACVERAQGRYVVGCPDLIENLDILAALRGGQTLCLDLIERPAWVHRKLAEINQLWFDAYDRIHALIRDDEGGSAFGAFCVWGPGKTAKVQCDASAMISPRMFREFVVPPLTAQCAWLDYSLYHLDGTQALVHLDALLEIEPLDAIEWTPQAGLEMGGHRRWHELYRRILAAGKSVQVVAVEPDEVIPLLDAVGREGVYLLVHFADEREVEPLLERVGRY